MFVSHVATLDVSFEVALARLAGLSGSGVLTRVSADAHAAGAPPGVPWLARSRFRNLVTRPDRAVLAIRWETGGHYTEPFPVLDADLTLIPGGYRHRLGLARDSGPGRAGSSALARGTRRRRQ